jgi:hypothetical protein
MLGLSPTHRSTRLPWLPSRSPSDRPQRIAFARSAPTGDMSGLKRKVVRQRRPAKYVAYALRTRVPDMSPNRHQLPTIATISYLRT